MYLGLAQADSPARIAMDYFPLKGWGKKVTYHERLKSSYTIIQNYWTTH